MENRRNTIVINKQFQYRRSLQLAAGAVLLVNSFLVMQMLFPGDMSLRLPTYMAVTLGALQSGLIIGIWWFCLRTSRRIAAPVQVFTREVAKLGAGDLTCDIALGDNGICRREGDAMNASIDQLRERLRHAKSLAGQIRQAQSSGVNPQDHLEELCDMLSEFKIDDDQLLTEAPRG